MKCPKCGYLGFETGDRCKNCGYDFSLLAQEQLEVEDLSLAPPVGDGPVGELWLEHPGGDEPIAEADAEAVPEVEGGSLAPPLSLPPLAPADALEDDEPLIRLPAQPRAPLAVRRAPDQPRSRPTARAPRRPDSGLVLEFAEEREETTQAVESPVPPPVARRSVPVVTVAGLGRRGVAAVIDHAILFGVDALVIYSTLRVASLGMSDWRVLPPAPLLAFLGLLKLAYFAAFTAMGGQTIGKMAAGIRVVGDDHELVDPGRAIRRTLAAAASLLPLGMGLIPAFYSPERRTFHDRVARTRVIDLPSA